MSTWLKLLPMELDTIKGFIEPEFTIKNTDKVVGEMSELTKKLFTLGRLLEKDGNQNKLDSHYCADNEHKLELEAKAAEYTMKAQAVKILMWIGVREELQLWSANIGIRSGFKVVVIPDNDNDDIPPFLKSLFGGDL